MSNNVTLYVEDEAGLREVGGILPLNRQPTSGAFNDVRVLRYECSYGQVSRVIVGTQGEADALLAALTARN